MLKATNDLEDCIANVSVITHSMGNYVFREALSALMSSSHAPAGTFINQYIAIGADISNTSLEPSGKGIGITRFSDRVTVYFSPHDSTLSKSKRKNGRPRFGRTLSSNYTKTPDGVVFVDCREWVNEKKLAEIGINTSVHSSYRSVPAILTDMFATLCEVDREAMPERESIDMNKLYRIKG